MTALLRIDALGVRYRGADRDALDGVDLELAPGERLAIVGESGSGKSTLGRAIAGLLPVGAAVRGAVAFPALGRPPVAGRDIGVVFQDPSSSLNPVLTVGEQVAEGLVRHERLGWRAAKARAAALFSRVHLPDPERLVGVYPHQLSGGQRQRVAIAAAVAAMPRLLIADEATSALDTIVQSETLALIDELVRDRGMALVFITHDIALAAGHSDRTAVIRDGRIAECGPTRSVVTRPRHPYTAELLAAHVDLATPPLVAGRPGQPS